MAGERQTGPDAETPVREAFIELSAQLDARIAELMAAEAEVAYLRAELEGMTDLHDQKHRDWQASEARAEAVRADTVAEIVAWLRQNGAPDLGGGYCDAAVEIEREFGCDAENGETA